MRVKWLCATLAIFGTTASAQSWQANSYDSGALIHGLAFVSGGSLSFSCTAPSPGGQPLTETGDHEALRTDSPYGFAVSLSTDLVDPSATDLNLSAPKMILDGQTFVLPSLTYSDFYGAWTGLSSVEMPGFLELFQTTKLIVDPGLGTAYEYPIDGLSAALDVAFRDCIARWFSLGHPMPPRLETYVGSGVAPGQPIPKPVPQQQVPTTGDLPQGLVRAPLFEIPDVAPRAAFDHLAMKCGGLFDVDRSYITATDLDQDGLADYVLHYGGVDCGDSTKNYCGASNCSIEVFMSSSGYRNPIEFLGHSLLPIVDERGQTGVLLTGGFSICGPTGQCLPPWFWDGTQFVGGR